MDNMRERIPIGDVLRVLGTLHDAMPKFDIAACTNRHAAHGEQENCLQREQPGNDQDPAQGRVRDRRAAALSSHHAKPTIKRRGSETISQIEKSVMASSWVQS